jgi:hypothetical protein
MNIDDYIEDKLADIKSDEERDNFERSIRFLITNNAVADFDYWSKVPVWTSAETALLINFIEPRVVIAANSQLLPAGDGLSLIKQSTEANTIFDRAISSGQMAATAHPMSQLYYAKKVGLTWPITLSEKVIKVHDKGLELDAEVARQLETLKKTASSEVEDLSLRKCENLLLLIGILKTALIDPNNKTLPFENQDTLGLWLEANFVENGPKLAGRGLKYNTLRHEFAIINKLLESFNIDSEPKPRSKSDG